MLYLIQTTYGSVPAQFGQVEGGVTPAAVLPVHPAQAAVRTPHGVGQVGIDAAHAQWKTPAARVCSRGREHLCATGHQAGEPGSQRRPIRIGSNQPWPVRAQEPLELGQVGGKIEPVEAGLADRRVAGGILADGILPQGVDAVIALQERGQLW